MKKYSLIISTILLAALFIKLLSNYSERFDEVKNNYLTTPKSAVNLVKSTSYNDLADVLHNHNNITSKDDADFVSKFISQKLDDGQSLSTLYDLNKRIWQIPVSLIDSIGSSGYKNKAGGGFTSVLCLCIPFPLQICSASRVSLSPRRPSVPV